jgi:5'-phosphate synthase pdxT subunit
MVKTAAVGVLALQGGFAAHARVLRGLLGGAEAAVREIRRCADLDALDALVLPGGESTALLTLMAGEPWLEALRAFHARGGALLGTCAGLILLAREVRPAQASAGLLDVTVARNGYGRQAESFEAPVVAAGQDGPLRGVFIRAPRIQRVGPGVEVLARAGDEVVAVRQGRVIGLTFHPELSGEPHLHRQLLDVAA